MNRQRGGGDGGLGQRRGENKKMFFFNDNFVQSISIL